MNSPLLRRRSLLAAGASVWLFGACSSGAGRPATDPSSPAGGSDGSGEFPAHVEHRIGTTTIESRPSRIVSVGLTEQDVLLQLGYQPIATTEWYGEEPDAVWPWAHHLLKGEPPTVLSTQDGFEFEKIAALRPDLIVGTNSGMTKQDYQKLSAFAPTVAMPKGDRPFFSPWADQVQLLAASVGRPEKGRKLVDTVKKRYAEVAAEHPEFAGKTATFSQGAPYDGSLYVYPAGLNTEFLSYLGFTMTPGLEKYSSGPGAQAAISAENLDLIDADVIVFASDSDAEVAKLRSISTYQTLSAVQGHRAVYTGHVLGGAVYFMTPLSLLYVLEHLTEHLADALAGKAPAKVVS